MYFVKINISGTDFEDIEELTVQKRLSELSNGGNFSCTFSNVGGRHHDDFNLGQEVLIYCGSSYPATGSLFTGILEDIEFLGEGCENNITIQGRDYTARLMDRTIEPEVYTNYGPGSIVRDILTKYIDNIGSTYVNDPTGQVISRMAFNHTNCYDAINQLAEIAGYIFYVDLDKQLHFEEEQTVYSPYYLSSGNVLNSNFRTQRNNIYNQVWVYGDRYLAGFRELFNPGSLTGSVATLLYKPHNTTVEWGGDIYKGGVYEMNLTPYSGAQYLVNFDDKQIIFTSGTSLGDNVPITSSGLISYFRDLPIVKYSQDNTSKNNYGTRDLVIINKDIKDPNMAADLMKSNLEKYKDPISEGTIKVKDMLNCNLGEMININLPYENAIGSDYQIIGTTHRFNTRTLKSQTPLTITVQ